MKNILITGGSGFIGSTFVKNLKKNKSYKVFHPTSKILNLTNLKSVNKFFSKNKIDYVIHTANHHVHPKDSKSKDSDSQLKNNLSMFFNLYINSPHYKRLINFGSGGELPRDKWNKNIKEIDIGKFIPKDQYGLSKMIISDFIKKIKNQKFINLRLFGVFGEKDNWQYRFIPNMCAHAVLNKDLEIHNNALFDFIYIDDVVKTTVRILNKKLKKHDYNLSTGKGCELYEIASKVLELNGNKKLKIKIPSKKIIVSYVGNNNRIKKDKLLCNMTPIETSIKNVLEYLKTIKNKINL
tara:strand:+ start:322 stop:1206 length:885 start_codon:yes stop_codon:yes gene_type:complete